MKKAILLTGFNNWGKSTHIKHLFYCSNFHFQQTYSIPEITARFAVQSQSNDDKGEEKFIEIVNKRITESPDAGENIFCAFCPTKELNNDSQRILNGQPFASYKEIHMLLLVNKWDHHASLNVLNIRTHLASIKNLKIHFIDADSAPTLTTDQDRQDARIKQIKSILAIIFP